MDCCVFYGLECTVKSVLYMLGPMILLWTKLSDSVLKKNSAAVEIHDYTAAVYVA